MTPVAPVISRAIGIVGLEKAETPAPRSASASNPNPVKAIMTSNARFVLQVA